MVVDAEAIEDRYAQFVACIQADDIPDDECPTPGDLLEQEREAEQGE